MIEKSFLPLALSLSLFAVTPTQTNAEMVTPDQIFSSINDYRAENNLILLENNPLLCSIAQVRVEEVAKLPVISHDGLRLVVNEAFAWENFQVIGENLARGPVLFLGNNMLVAWKNSPPHNANLLSPIFTEGCVATDDFNASLILGQPVQ